ncbi:hypothetical protein H310_13938 [Aphanomyces invadans]|uniref:Uncharacterized protein n=1 Tax=Aphanomyces invadans TaxID=157072 RepID=A0A024TD90_9STRA|nr:hypothetical protein H310_13938 [Aphanomyces invadans]ETV91556.1 hypothetical protein H310_13938 [Aphanomyces invadans]|eukprot:XP_008879824.1 hypothetical protein H310_13938 [Aphanomyces invadans]
MVRPAAIATATTSSSDAMPTAAVFASSPALNVQCNRGDDDVILMVPSEEYSVSLLRKQLNSIGFERTRSARMPNNGETAPSVHYASLTFVQPTTPPTSPQPKDLLRHHLKTRQKQTVLDNTSCHIMYVDAMDVRNTARGGSQSASSSSSCPSGHHQFKEGLRKRKSSFMSDDNFAEPDNDDVAMDPAGETQPNDPTPNNAQKLAEFHRDAYGFQLLDHGRGNFAACS